MSQITSRSNPRVKQMRALRQRKEREATGLCLIEGVRHVTEAASAGITLESIAYAPEQLTSPFVLAFIRQQAERGVSCLALSSEVFDSIADKDSPQSIVAIAHQRTTDLAELSPANMAWGVALVAPQDPGNVGSILRTMNAVGAGALILIDSAVDPYHPTCIRASMGALFWHPVTRATFGQFATWASKQGYHILGTSVHGTVDYRQADYTPPLVLLMGSEREGLSERQEEICRQLVRLPMRGRVSSLNLSVATGVMLYAAFERLEMSVPHRCEQPSL
ncbi:MAG: RNA methyltransferase [Anaerolineae bacterium]|nr:RNA methyltransferase [Thermoflexales bacterium]MDW8406160.1 RNA methyltransferase [Anaerolineae bacterium]